MIIISNTLIETLNTVKNPISNRYPFLTSTLENIENFPSSKKELIEEHVFIELFKNSWNAVNSNIPIKSIEFDVTTNSYKANAVITTYLTKSQIIEVTFSLKINYQNLTFSLKCTQVTAQKRTRTSSRYTDVNLSTQKIQNYMIKINEAIQKAENKFKVDYLSIDSLKKSNVSKNIKKFIEEKLNENVQLALWNTLFSAGYSEFNGVEAQHIMKLYDKAINCFIDYSKVQERRRFSIFEKAITRARAKQESDFQVLYYEIVKNGLDIHVKIKKEQIWTKVAEKRGRTASEQLVTVKVDSYRTKSKNILDIIYVLYESNKGVLESFSVYDLWSLLKVK